MCGVPSSILLLACSLLLAGRRRPLCFALPGRTLRRFNREAAVNVVSKTSQGGWEFKSCMQSRSGSETCHWTAQRVGPQAMRLLMIGEGVIRPLGSQSGAQRKEI